MTSDALTDRGLTAQAAWDRLLGVRTEQEAHLAELVRHESGSWGWTQDASDEARRLADLYTPLCLAGPHCTFAQLGVSLDGRIATRTGDAVFVTGEQDRRHLHHLRALADAVVVGVDTVIADDPRLTVRACAGSNPVRVVLDHRGRAPVHSGVFTDDAAATVWVLGCADRSAPDGVDVLRLPCDEHGFSARDVVSALARRGLGRVLVEGGGVTVSRFLQEQALHRLYTTLAPVLIGDGVAGLSFSGPSRMRDALRAPSRRFTLGDDTLFELDLAAATTQQQDHEPG